MLDAQLVEAIARNFGLEPGEVSSETGPETAPEWDSVGHLRLILDVEEAYGVRFPTREISLLTSAGRIQSALDRLRSGERT
jgi:acyl carrier protein